MDVLMDTQRGKWLKLHYLAVLLLMLYAVSGPLEPYGGWLAFGKLHIVFCSVVFAFYFYFRRLNTEVEARLLLLLGIWLYITRALNGDIFLIDEFNIVFDIFFCYVILDTGMLLDRKHREKMFDWISIACGVVFSVLGILSIAAALKQTTIVIPISGRTVEMVGAGFKRLSVNSENPNVCGIWFALAAVLMACQFVKCRHRLWRAPIVLAILINYFALTLTFSRNSMLSFCIGCALLGMLAVMGWLKRSKKWLRILTGVVTAAILLLGFYKSFDLSAALISKATAALTPTVNTVSDAGVEKTLAKHITPEEAEIIVLASDKQTEEPVYSEKRDLMKSISNLSDRIPIYRSVFYSFEQQPKRLVIGCAYKDVMTISNTVLPQNYTHLHNSFLQGFALTGLPGFLLIMAFLVLVVVRMIRLFFSEKTEAEMWVKSLTAPLAAILTYNLFETTLFYYYDFRGEIIFFLAGLLLGFYYDLYPAQKNKKSGNRFSLLGFGRQV